MDQVPVKIDSKIRIPDGAIPYEVRQQIKQALEIPNRAKEEAKKMDQWGWQSLPDTIQLWSTDTEGCLEAPRGFLSDLIAGLRENGLNPHFDSTGQTHPDSYDPKDVSIELYKWQVPAVQAIYSYGNGIIKQPAGSGKSVVVLAAMEMIGSKSLVIVSTIDVLHQWKKNVKEFLGKDAGQIGDGVSDIRDITIATAQTLTTRLEEYIHSGLFEEFSFVCLDEMHHATAPTYNSLLDRFTSAYRIGISATPDKTGEFALAKAVLGPIIHETHPDEVDILIKPKVIRVNTDFDFPFKGQKGRRRSNYSKMVETLVEDEDRNELIVSNIIKNKGHHQLVVSKRLGQLNRISDILEEKGFGDPVVTIYGENDTEHRIEAKRLAEEKPCVILSTVAHEALDIKRLDRGHIIFPIKNPGSVTQIVGRFERRHPDKKDCIIYDYNDFKVGVLNAQWRSRRFDVYEKRGYLIENGSNNL